MATSDLHLEPITRSNWRSALRVKTTSEQLRFVADYEPVALVMLAKSYVSAADCDWHPLAISTAERIVGIVAIARQGSLCQIFHLVIDRDSQGQGIGRAAVPLILEYIRRELPECKQVVLTVHPDNEVARHLYQSCGFRDSGVIRDAEPEMELFL